MWTNKSLSELTTISSGSFVKRAAEFGIGSGQKNKPRQYTDEEANIMLSAMRFEVENFKKINRTPTTLEVIAIDGTSTDYVSTAEAANLTDIDKKTWTLRAESGDYTTEFVGKWYIKKSEVRTQYIEKKKITSIEKEGVEYITLQKAEEQSGLKAATWWLRIDKGRANGIYENGRWYVQKDQAVSKKNPEGTYGYTGLATSFGKHPGCIRHLEKKGLITHKTGPCGKYFTQADYDVVETYYEGRKKEEQERKIESAKKPKREASKRKSPSRKKETKSQPKKKAPTTPSRKQTGKSPAAARKKKEQEAAKKKRGEERERKAAEKLRIATEKRLAQEKKLKEIKQKKKEKEKREAERANLGEEKRSKAEEEKKNPFAYVASLTEQIKADEPSEFETQFLSDLERISAGYTHLGHERAWDRAKSTTLMSYGEIYRLFEQKETIQGKEKKNLTMFLQMLTIFSEE